MKITIEKNLVTLRPEGDEERAKTELLWKILIDCVNQTRKLAPVGEYAPAKGKLEAAFAIEGYDGNPQPYLEVRAPRDCRVYCVTCNRIEDIKAGDPIPLCCGKRMEIVD